MPKLITDPNELIKNLEEDIKDHEKWGEREKAKKSQELLDNYIEYLRTGKSKYPRVNNFIY